MSWLLHRLAHETVKFLAVLPVRGNQARGCTVRIWEEGGREESEGWREESEGWREERRDGGRRVRDGGGEGGREGGDGNKGGREGGREGWKEGGGGRRRKGREGGKEEGRDRGTYMCILSQLDILSCGSGHPSLYHSGGGCMASSLYPAPSPSSGNSVHAVTRPVVAE